MGPVPLAHVLRPLIETFGADKYPELLVGLGLSDDAAVYQLNDEQALVQTIDFFPQWWTMPTPSARLRPPTP